MNPPDVRLFFSSQCWIESLAIDQLRQTASLPGMQFVVGLPDLHPGKGGPVGAAFFSTAHIYPLLVGNDVGCGMFLGQTNLAPRKIKLDRCFKKVSGLEESYEGDRQQWLSLFDLHSSQYDEALGTIGGGNHFAELQVIDEVLEPQDFKMLSLSEEYAFILVHSGSRSIGEMILRHHTRTVGLGGLLMGTPEAKDYLAWNDYAVRWAKANRSLIAHRFAQLLQAEVQPILDLPHNTVTQVWFEKDHGFLHRKGASPSDSPVLIIPGSRGTLSYLVKPINNQSSNAYSLAHSEVQSRIIGRALTSASQNNDFDIVLGHGYVV